jgi:hypothetical protein
VFYYSLSFFQTRTTPSVDPYFTNIIYLCIYISIYICAFMYMYIRTYAHTYIYTYTHTHIHDIYITSYQLITVTTTVSFFCLFTRLSPQNNRDKFIYYNQSRYTNFNNAPLQPPTPKFSSSTRSCGFCEIVFELSKRSLVICLYVLQHKSKPIYVIVIK